MAEPVGEAVPVTAAKEPEAVVEEIVEKADGGGVESSPPVPAADDVTVKSRGFSFGGKQNSRDKKSVHKILGGGKPADVLLWKDWKISASVVGGATLLWVLFEVLDYHILTLIAHLLIVSLAILFLWSKASILINKEPPKIPEVHISEEFAVDLAKALRNDINRAIAMLREIALGHDLMKFVGFIVGLWVLSEIGSCGDLLTLIYVAVLMLHTLPILYDKYQDKVDHYVDRAMVELKKHYGVLEEKFLSKIPRGPAKDKKQV